MANKEEKGEVVKAVFMGDSKTFHKYQIIGGKYVGTIYTPKAEEAPKSLTLELVAA